MWQIMHDLWMLNTLADHPIERIEWKKGTQLAEAKLMYKNWIRLNTYET